MKDELGEGRKNDYSIVCLAGSESEGCVWSGIAVAHDDTCTIWK